MTSGGEEIASSVVEYYSTLIHGLDIDAVAEQRQPLQLPQWPADDLSILLSATKDIFAAENVSLQVSGAFVVVGDLHGQLLDLLRVLQTCGFPPSTMLMFLGDIVDRGEFSIETCSLVFALKVKYPDSVFVIRGNHEFAFLCQRGGFKAEIDSTYGTDGNLWQGFLGAFSVMPLTAVINQKMLCVHGGLGPSWFSMSQARRIERPIDEFGDDILDAMLWSDPNANVSFYEPSERGTGFFYGEQAVGEFLDTNALTMLIRAHECVNTGCAFLFDNKCVTVFSASNYGGLVPNNSAVLEIGEDCEYTVKQFPPLQYLKRGSARFGKMVDGKFVSVAHKAAAVKGKLSSPRLPPLMGLGPAIRGTESARGVGGMSKPGWCGSPRVALVPIHRKA
jgi:protein phosphatase